MKVTLSKRVDLPAIPLPCTLILNTTVHAETNKLVIKSGSGTRSHQYTTMEKKRWNNMHNLYQRVDKRIKKEWDKADTISDSRDKYKQDASINAYREPNTLCCLNRRTGHVTTP